MNKKIIGPYKAIFYILCTITILQSAITIILIYFLGNTIQKAVENEGTKFYIQLSIMGSLTLADVLIAYVNNRFKAKLEENIALNIRKNVVKNIYSYVDENLNIDPGRLNSIMLNDVQTIVSSRLSAIFTFIGGATLFFGSLIIMFITSWIVSLIVIFSSLLTIIVPLFLSNRMSKLQFEMSENRNTYNSNLAKDLNDFKSYRFTNSLSKLQLRIAGFNSDFEKINQKLFVKNNITVALVTFVSISFQMSVVVVSVIFYRLDFISIAAVVMVSFLMGNTSGGLQSMLYSIPEYQMAKKLYDQRIFERERKAKKQLIKNIKLVDFTPIRDNKEIYPKKLNVSFEEGKKYRLQGRNGSGKSLMYSTLITQNAFSGEILVNNEKGNINWFEGSFWLLQTNPKIFNGSVVENITLFSKKPNIEKIKNILEELNVGKLIDESDSTKISDGQKQRIAIARAIYFDAQWIFLDEALSSLDLETSQKVLTFIGSRCKTICVTSHHEIMGGEWYDETITLS